MTHHYLLAHDLGTTGNKSTLFDAEEGLALASTFEAYPTFYPQPAWAEQDPADWERAIWLATRALLSKTGIEPAGIAAVSFSGTMQGALLVDRQGAPLGQAIIWADQRSTAQAEWIGSVCDPQALYYLTGQRLSPAYTAPKLLWIKEHEPQNYEKAYKCLQAKDYAAFLLTGVFATDPSDASGTLLYDLLGGHWATDLIRALGLNNGLFPEVHASTDVIGHVTPAAASASGLLAGTPVVIGGGDGACATVGSGSVREGEAYAYLGSSSWIALTSRQPIYDPQQRTYTMAHLIPGYFFPLGTMQAAGGSFGWLERLFYPLGDAQAMQSMDAAAASVPAGANGLLFLPYLLGERSPYWNPQARGALVGLAMPHGQAEFARAVLEGVALNLGLILEALRAQDVQVGRLLLIGGGSRSAVWRQILADVLDLPIWLPALTTEATALGALVAGGVGVGLFPDFNVVDRLVSPRQAERSQLAAARHYAALLDLFRQTYQALDPIFAKLTRLAGEPVVEAQES
ncbi:MAG: xylulokinase [Anaerolineales bacterium]|jgi:xylulokinase